MRVNDTRRVCDVTAQTWSVALRTCQTRLLVLRCVPFAATARCEAGDLQDNSGMAASGDDVQRGADVLCESADGYLDVVGSANGDGDMYSGYAAPASATVKGGGHGDLYSGYAAPASATAKGGGQGDLYSVPFAAPAKKAAGGSGLCSGHADPTPTEDGGDLYSGHATPAPTVGLHAHACTHEAPTCVSVHHWLCSARNLSSLCPFDTRLSGQVPLVYSHVLLMLTAGLMVCLRCTGSAQFAGKGRPRAACRRDVCSAGAGRRRRLPIRVGRQLNILVA